MKRPFFRRKTLQRKIAEVTLYVVASADGQI